MPWAQGCSQSVGVHSHSNLYIYIQTPTFVKLYSHIYDMHVPSQCCIGTQIADVLLDVDTVGVQTVKGFATIDNVALINVEVRLHCCAICHHTDMLNLMLLMKLANTHESRTLCTAPYLLATQRKSTPLGVVWEAMGNRWPPYPVSRSIDKQNTNTTESYIANYPGFLPSPSQSSLSSARLNSTPWQFAVSAAQNTKECWHSLCMTQ